VFLRTVSCVARHHPTMPTSTSCSRPTTRSCVTSLTTSRRCTASVASVAVCLRGSTLNVGGHGETVVDWSVGIGEQAVWRTAGCGLRQHVAGSTYIVGRRTSTGVNDWCAAVARRRCCGAHCHLCLVEITTYPAPLITQLMALRYFLPARLTLFAPTQLVWCHHWCRRLPRRHCRVSGSVLRKRYVDCSCRRQSSPAHSTQSRRF